MYFDSLLMFDSALDIHGGSVASTNSIPLGSRVNYDDAWNSHPGNSNIGAGNQVKVGFLINDAVVSSGAPTLVVALQDSADNATFANILLSATLAGATLATACGSNTSGYELEMTVPNSTRKYLGAYYTIGGTGGFTSMTITGGILLDVQTNGVW
jgi:hypothetical protein